MSSEWDRKLDCGAVRCGCVACGAHTLVVRAVAVPRCVCCGSLELVSVDDADALNGAMQRRRHPLRIAPGT